MRIQAARLDPFGKESLTFAAFLAALSAAFAWLRVPQSYWLLDVLANTEGARRVAAGERLFRDFLSPIGPSSFALQSLFLRFSLTPGAAFQAASAAWAFVCGSVAWFRISTPSLFFRWVAAVFLALLAALSSAPGVEHWELTSYAGNYNNYGLALLLLILVELARTFLGSGSPFLLGALAAVFALIKFTNGIVVLPILAVAAIAQLRQRKVAPAWMVAGLLTGMAAVYLLAPYSLSGYFDCSRQMITVAMGGSGETGRLLTRLRDLPHDVFGLMLITAYLATLNRGSEQKGRRRGFLLLVLIAYAEIFLFDYGAASHPMVLAPAILGLLTAVYYGESEATEILGARFGVSIACLLLSLSLVVANLAYLGLWNIRYHGGSTAESVLGFAVPKPPVFDATKQPSNFNSPADNYVFALAYRDALALAVGRVKSSDVVLSDDFTNVLVAGGLAKGSLGDNIAWHWGRNVDDRNVESLRQMALTADWVIAWRRPFDLMEPKERAVAGVIAGRFHVETKSEYWVLWRRNAPSKP